VRLEPVEGFDLSQIVDLFYRVENTLHTLYSNFLSGLGGLSLDDF